MTRELDDTRLLRLIRTAHEASRRTYGAPRIWRALRRDGVAVGRDRVARLMRVAGLRGAARRRFVVTTRRDERARPAPDLVLRRFEADRPNRLWVADVTYVPTLAGFLYLAVVLDVFSRKVVGWAMETYLRTELELAALEMAIAQRRPKDVIHHSDQGCQYTSIAFSERCAAAGVRSSMGSVGDAYDNAMAESFFATLACELLAGTRLESPAHAKDVIFEWIEAWYNTQRMHSSIGYLAPVEYERRHAARNGEPESGGAPPPTPGREKDDLEKKIRSSAREVPKALNRPRTQATSAARRIEQPTGRPSGWSAWHTSGRAAGQLQRLVGQLRRR